jgi:hypothetical protein
MNNFINEERTFAFAPGMMAQFELLAENFGDELPDGASMIKTVAARWDDAEQTRKRAATLDNEVPFKLTDGRIAIAALWSNKLITAWEQGLVPAEELTPDQFKELLLPPEELER